MLRTRWLATWVAVGAMSVLAAAGSARAEERTAEGIWQINPLSADAAEYTIPLKGYLEARVVACRVWQPPQFQWTLTRVLADLPWYRPWQPYERQFQESLEQWRNRLPARREPTPPVDQSRHPRALAPTFPYDFAPWELDDCALRFLFTAKRLGDGTSLRTTATNSSCSVHIAPVGLAPGRQFLEIALLFVDTRRSIWYVDQQEWHAPDEATFQAKLDDMKSTGWVEPDPKRTWMGRGSIYYNLAAGKAATLNVKLLVTDENQKTQVLLPCNFLLPSQPDINAETALRMAKRGQAFVTQLHLEEDGELGFQLDAGLEAMQSRVTLDGPTPKFQDMQQLSLCPQGATYAVLLYQIPAGASDMGLLVNDLGHAESETGEQVPVKLPAKLPVADPSARPKPSRGPEPLPSEIINQLRTEYSR